MFVLQIALLTVFVTLELTFFAIWFFFRITKPIERREGNRYISDSGKHQVWLRHANRAEKLMNPLLLHSVALSALALWVIIRVVISFL